MKQRSRQRGYNLIELLVAIALLGVVMLAIASLFIWGRKNVYSGKQMTTAIAVGTRVMEDLSPLTKKDIYEGLFAITDDETGQNLKFGNPEKEYTNAALRSTKATIITGYGSIQKQNESGLKPLTEAWADQLVENPDDETNPKRARLDDGAVTVLLMPRSDTKEPATFGGGSVMQIRVVVSWIENRRRREVILDSVKAQ